MAPAETESHGSMLERILAALGFIIGWGWAIVAGGGGFGLILTEGPLPLTHGWYAMFSGIALCPATAWLVKRTTKVELSFLVRFIIAALFIVAGRLALVIGPWPLGPH